MKDIVFLAIAFSFVAVMWFCIGYRQGFRRGQYSERKAITDRLEVIDTLHKKAYENIKKKNYDIY